MSRPFKAMSCLALLCALALAGCGGTSNAPTIPAIAFGSPAIRTTIPSQYTCDGKNLAPPLRWGSVPANTSELAVVLVSFTKGETANSYTVSSIDWALAGISPRLHSLAAGEVPRGAYVGRRVGDKKDYSVCPKLGSQEEFQFELWALPASVKVPPHFGDYGAFRVFNASKSSPAIAHGAFAAKYTRRR
jgi:phosphatidylethanolamine-binding protein (PEBP) family uncharacterized protein